MKLKENLKYFVIAGIIFFVVYLFAAARPLQSELILKPEWTITLSEDMADEEALSAGKDNLEPFILGSKLGYFTDDGKLVFQKTFPKRASISRNVWTEYGTDTQDIPLFTPEGTQTGVIRGSGFPYIDEERIYLLQPGGAGIAACNTDGTQQWIYEGISPIISFSSSSAGAVIGYADGRFVYLTPEGKERYSFYPGGSAWPVILGGDISESGNLAACISGQEDQRFLLIKSSGDQYKIIFHEYLPGNLRRQTFVRFDSTEEFVFYEYDGGLGIVNCITKKSSKIPIPGKIISFGESDKDNLFLILSKDGSEYRISILEKPDHLIASTTFPANHAFLIHRGNSFYLGCDNTISCITISKG